MRAVLKVVLLLIVGSLILSGCVASSAHVEEGDNLLYKIGEVVASMSEKMAQQDPTYLSDAIRADELVPQLKKHAEEPAIPPGLSKTIEAGSGALQLWLGGGTAMTVLGFAARKAIAAYSEMKTTAKDVATMPPEEAKEHLRKKNIHV